MATRSWVGLGDFVLVVGSTPAAVVRLTPSATQELLRMLGHESREGHAGPEDADGRSEPT